MQGTFIMAVAFMLMMFAWFGSFIARRYQRRNYIRLPTEEVRALDQVVSDIGTNQNLQVRVENLSYGTRGEKC